MNSFKKKIIKQLKKNKNKAFVSKHASRPS